LDGEHILLACRDKATVVAVFDVLRLCDPRGINAPPELRVDGNAVNDGLRETLKDPKVPNVLFTQRDAIVITTVGFPPKCPIGYDIPLAITDGLVAELFVPRPFLG
jgi:hypothetical protein